MFQVLDKSKKLQQSSKEESSTIATDMPPAIQDKIEITGISHIHYDAGASISFPTTKSALIVTLSGHGIIELDKHKFKVNPSVIVNALPHMNISYHTKTDFEHCVVYYKLTNPMCKRLTKFALPFEMSIYNKDEVIKNLTALMDLFNSHDLNAVLKQKLTAQTFFHSLFSDEDMHRADPMNHFIDYMSSHLTENMTLDKLASAFNLSSNQFSYLFHKYFGIRPIDYLIKLRLEKSLGLLQEGYSVKETSINVGYSDPLYFSRLFKKHYGMSPNTFKKSVS